MNTRCASMHRRAAKRGYRLCRAGALDVLDMPAYMKRTTVKIPDALDARLRHEAERREQPLPKSAARLLRPISAVRRRGAGWARPVPGTAAAATCLSASKRSSPPRSPDSRDRPRRRTALRLRRRRRRPSRCCTRPSRHTPRATHRPHPGHHRSHPSARHSPRDRTRSPVPGRCRRRRLHRPAGASRRLVAHRRARRALPRPRPASRHSRCLGHHHSRTPRHHRHRDRRPTRLRRRPPKPRRSFHASAVSARVSSRTDAASG